MASSKRSKAEKEISNGESSKRARNAIKPRKENVKEKKKHKNKSKLSNANGNVKNNKALIVHSSSTESLKEPKKAHRRDNNGIANGRTSGTKPKKGKRNGYEAEHKGDAKTERFPMNRIRTIMKAEDPDLRVSEEAILVINKATVKFIEQFTREAYACSVQDRKKFLGYQRLSHVVSKKRRYDFLLDFVPEKLKAEDALREI